MLLDVSEARQNRDPRVDLAVQRTELACGRTLLAWIRTTFGLMAAGVAFDKGASLLHEAHLAAGTAWVRTGHFVGLTVTGASIVLLAIATWDYIVAMRKLARMQGLLPPRFTPALVAAILVIVLGCAALYVLAVSP